MRPWASAVLLSGLVTGVACDHRSADAPVPAPGPAAEEPAAPASGERATPVEEEPGEAAGRMGELLRETAEQDDGWSQGLGWHGTGTENDGPVIGGTAALGSEEATGAGYGSGSGFRCPPDPFLEELHAAAFHFEHGPARTGRAHLSRARARRPANLDARSREILARLRVVADVVESDRAAARAETERVRLALGDWPCLTDPLHDRFHEALPPVP